MSNRVVVIKILGVGLITDGAPAEFRTRGGSIGTVVSLADQLSSEIQVFGSMGSDSTTSFTILSTAATRQLLLSRGKVPVLDATTSQPVRLAGYVLPAPGAVEIPVGGTLLSLFTVGGYYRIQNTVFRITSISPVLVGTRAPHDPEVVGSNPTPPSIFSFNSLVECP